MSPWWMLGAVDDVAAGDDVEVQAVRALFWASVTGDGVAAGVVWRTMRDLL